MPTNLARQRAIVSSLMVEAMVTIVEGQREQDEPTHHDMIAIWWLLLLCASEKRPCSAQMISNYTRIPRTTVIRKLGLMTKRSWVERVGRGFTLSDSRLQAPTPQMALQRIAKAVVRAGQKLSKLDN